MKTLRRQPLKTLQMATTKMCDVPIYNLKSGMSALNFPTLSKEDIMSPLPTLQTVSNLTIHDS